MSKSIQEEALSVLWFILALLLWRYEYRILSILALIKGIECTFWAIVLAFIDGYQKYKEGKTLMDILKDKA